MLLTLLLLFLCYFRGVFGDPSRASCDAVPNPSRLDCHPEPWATEAECLRRNCCWSLVDKDRTTACYFPADYPTYEAIEGTYTAGPCGVSVKAKRSSGSYPVPPDPVDTVQLEAIFETETRLRVRITDANNKRWEPPIELGPADKSCPANRNYSVTISLDRLGFSVSRLQPNGDNVTLLDSTGLMASALVYADQYLQMAFKVRAIHGYGLGEREDTFPMDMHSWKRMVFWARDGIPELNTNLYGVHPFFLGIAPDGTAFGFFFFNSNAFEVMKQPLPSFAFRTLGGILDFFIFTGPTPNAVIEQYYDLIGHPPVPPYWALGYQLCRYGYTGVEEVRKLVEDNKKAGIPQDVQWFDIDYMDETRDWTLSKTEGFKGLSQFVKDELQDKHGLRVVAIVDPAIPTRAGDDYQPYNEGLSLGVFVNDSRSGTPLLGVVWPGETVFPDFTKPATADWWYQCAKDFKEKLNFDGLWIDMNEPSNFVDGSVAGCDRNNKLDNPPYTPQVLGGNLQSKTICPSGLHDNNVPHYNLHNLYGLFEAKATFQVLRRINPGKRPFILTRSSFAGSGRYTTHWTGDIHATWEAMATTISQMINFNLFGIPMVGADICGFSENTTEELCVRWTQLGAFYPFSRNHNGLGLRPQDPASWSEASQKAIAKALDMRYQILPYLYTLLHGSMIAGHPVVKALAFDYPTDLATHHNARQFLLGSCLNIAPVLGEGMDFTPVYFPEGDWVEMTTLKRYSTPGKFLPVPAPLNRIPVFYKAGCILPMHPSGAMNTLEARKSGLGVTVVLSKVNNGTASGELSWDDGESEGGPLLLVEFEVSKQKLSAISKTVTLYEDEWLDEGALDEEVPLVFVRIIGVTIQPTTVSVNGKPCQFDYEEDNQLLTVNKFDTHVDLRQQWNFEWK